MFGEVAEWFKAVDSKSTVLQKGTAGSNPALSARVKNTILKSLKKRFIDKRLKGYYNNNIIEKFIKKEVI